MGTCTFGIYLGPQPTQHDNFLDYVKYPPKPLSVVYVRQLQARRPVRRSAFTAHHLDGRFRWFQEHIRWRRVKWKSSLFRYISLRSEQIDNPKSINVTFGRISDVPHTHFGKENKITHFDINLRFTVIFIGLFTHIQIFWTCTVYIYIG